MTRVTAFPPIIGRQPRILLLGSLPGVASVRAGEYYAHPRNSFWPILTALLDIDDDSYAQRTAQVVRRGIAIWDVLQACYRSGSPDSAIDERSIVANDFPDFFRRHPQIRRVFFNGAKAESVYRRHVLPVLSGSAASLPLQRLPSTSPAHAGMSLERKTAAWRVILLYALE